MSNAIMRSSDFKAAVEPILNTGFDGIYDVRTDEWQAFVSSQKAPHERSYFEEYVQYGFGQAPELPDGQAVTYQSGGILYSKRYEYKVYGLAFALTKVLVEDGDHIAIGTTYAKYLAQAMKETKETRLANILNRAFNSSYVGGDKVQLISNSPGTAHPIANGASFSNGFNTPAVLSQTSLEQMVINIRNAVDNKGKKIRLTPKNLIIPTSQIMQAEVILKTALKTGSNFNDINPIASKGVIKGEAKDISRLTSPDAWFLTTSANDDMGIKLITRRKLTKSMEGDFETDNMKYKATERYGDGWTDPRCIYGTSGI